ncbi:MAG TPA: hypothetical protein VMS96_13315 [Terriglobales bacterium]|nr:hypothetical protein [Terriglobales bacterium]
MLSPDKRFELINVDSDKEPHHSIFLKERKTGQSRKVYEYGRSAAVLWAPDSKHFALNDHAGSDFTNTYVVAVDESTPRIDVQEEIQHFVKGLAGGHHEYFGVARWLDNRTVVVHHWGHGDGDAFCDCIIYVLSESAKKCKRQGKARDPEQLCDDMTP